jgi:hypothetical protein
MQRRKLADDGVVSSIDAIQKTNYYWFPLVDVYNVLMLTYTTLKDWLL